MFNTDKFDGEAVAAYLVKSLYAYCKEYNIKHLVTGISGGVDSAVVYALCAKANEIYGDNVIQHYGVRIPIQSDSDSMDRADLVMERYKGICHYLPNMNVPCKELFNYLIHTHPDPKRLDISQGNVKARLRMITLYHIANTRQGGQGMVMSTDNLSEYLMGFWTLHGDVGDYGMIQELWKTEVYELAKVLGVPQCVIDAKPDDGLGITDGGDEAQLGAPYEVIDYVMSILLSCHFIPDGGLWQLNQLQEVPGVDSKLVCKLAKRCLTTSFKRHNPERTRRDCLGLESYDYLTT